MKPHWLTWDELSSQFPKDGEFRDGMRPVQETGLRFIADKGDSILELPTGSGKTAMEVAICRTARHNHKRSFLVTPTKAIVAQIIERFPKDFVVALGRTDFPCFYYEKEKSGLSVESETKFRADQIPCSMLRDCPHRVNQETGETHEPGAIPCPYLKQKFEARHTTKPVLATLAFYLYSRLFSKDFPEPDVLVIDEAHRIPETVRSALSYDITDWHLEKAVDMFERADQKQAAESLARFRKRMISIVKKKPAFRGTLLSAEEITGLVEILGEIDENAVRYAVSKAILENRLDSEKEVDVLKKIEGVVSNLRRYIRSLEFSLPLANRGALAYTYAYHVEEKGENDRVQHKLVVCSHHIAGLMKLLLGKTTVALSATIGDCTIFSQESGIKGAFTSVQPSFPPEHTRICMPIDTPNLAFNERKRGAVTNVMRRMARSAKKLARGGIRSLHVVVSNEERMKLLEIMAGEGVKAISYGNGVTAREAAQRFKDGEGDSLVGTASHFGEGIDLPRQVAGVIFGLRPAYPPPDAPRTQFEERRYGNQRWAIWNWRVMLSILQWRGRNIRSDDDLGVSVFISQQFRRTVFGSLPKSLQVSYRGEWTLDQCVSEAEKLVG